MMGVTMTAAPTAPRTMVPSDAALPEVLPTDRLNVRGVLVRPWRDELRRIPTVRNVVTTLGAFAQTFGVVTAAAVVNTWWAYLSAFVWMGRGHVLLNILAHEAAHRLLFPNRFANDTIGRMVGFSTFQPFTVYRRSHFAHHRDEMGPDEPDTDLYRGYPITKSSWHRKLWRDATGQSAVKITKALLRAARKGVPDAIQILITQLVMFGVAIAVERPFAYVVWIASWATLWRVLNRLRAIAEHGGMERSKDRRRTTHVIRQSRLARFCMVPYNTGWHLAHHTDMGVPWRNLPKFHAELLASGWVTPDVEYPSYRAFWRACSSRPET